MKRLRRVATAWWWVVVLAGVVGLVAAAGAVRARNHSITREFEAQAVVPIETPETGQRGEKASEPLDAALVQATEVNADLLEQFEAVITTDTAESLLVFSARGEDENAVSSLVEELRTNYVIAAFGAVDFQERMDLMLAEAIEVKIALDALQPTITTAPVITLDPTTQARLDFLIIQAGALENEIPKLVGNLVLAEAGDTRNGTVSEINGQIDSVRQKLADIYIELEGIPTYDPSMLEVSRGGESTASTDATTDTTLAQGDTAGTGRTEISIPEDEDEIAPGWQIAALEERYLQLQTQYESSFVNSITGQVDPLEPVDVRDATLTRIPVVVGAATGFGLGAVLAMLSIFFINKVRGPLWVAKDLYPLPLVVEAPKKAGDPKNRRGRKRLERRRGAVQQMRGGVVRFLESDPSSKVVGLIGLRTEASDTSALVSELAAGIGATDRSVAVLDVAFDVQPSSFEADVYGQPTVAGFLALAKKDPEAARTDLKKVFVEPNAGLPRVSILRAGTIQTDPADVLLGRSFDLLLTETRSHVDLVLIAGPGSGRETIVDSLSQRLDGVLAVCRTRATRERDVVELVDRLKGPGAELLGSVLLVGRKRSFRLPWKSKAAADGSGRQLSDLEMLPGIIAGDASGGSAESSKAIARHRRRSQLARFRVQTRIPTSRWRALPDFLIVGAQRSGTSSLYKYLGQHPSVVPSIRKETEFLASRHSEGEKWYRAHFPLERDKTSQLVGGRRLTFEADPSYLLDPRAALRASLLLPEAKIIVLLRDPVERAISHYNHNVRIGQEHLPLREALDLEPDRLRGEVEKMAADPEYPAKQFLRYSYATRGMYAEQLERWLEFYPSDRVRVVHSEDLFRDTSGVYQWLLDFLELPDFQPSSFENFSYSGGARESGRVAASEEEVERLKALFAPHNERLYQLIDQDFGW